VGISKCLPAYCKEDTPEACYNDIPKKDLAEVKKIGDLFGSKALTILIKATKSQGKPAAAGDYLSGGPVDVSSLKRMCKDDLGLMQQPTMPKYKTALVGIFVRGVPYGGSDKSSNGHRYDTIPFANGIIFLWHELPVDSVRPRRARQVLRGL
jgi:hypothetical protein